MMTIRFASFVAATIAGLQLRAPSLIDQCRGASQDIDELIFGAMPMARDAQQPGGRVT